MGKFKKGDRVIIPTNKKPNGEWWFGCVNECEKAIGCTGTIQGVCDIWYDRSTPYTRYFVTMDNLKSGENNRLCIEPLMELVDIITLQDYQNIRGVV